METKVVVRRILAPPAVTIASASEYKRRRAHWAFFQMVGSFAYAGIIADMITTAMGFQRMGSGYEQNPLGSLLIGRLGWIGLFVVVTSLCSICYMSCRTVYWRMPIRWSVLLNIVLFFLAITRWLVVALTIQWLINGH